MLWIDTTAALERQLGGVGGGPLALDTEADSFYHYREKVCLVQLSFGGRDVLVDPLSGTDLGGLAPLLGSPPLRKILHGADYDLRLLHRDFGLEVRGLFDTMIAARLVGERSFGLAALLEKHLDVQLDKRFQRADWSRRPLSPEMKEYAALDTRHLESLAACLEQRLRELGREAWAREEFELLEALCRKESGPRPEGYLRIKGLRSLDRRGRAVLRELARWREQEAERRDVPLFRILADEVLLQVATARAIGALKGLEGLRPGDLGGLQQALECGLALPEAELPPPLEEPGPRPSAAAEARLRRTAERRDRLAEELGLEPSVLASRTALERALTALDLGQGLERVPGLRHWQAELLGPLL